MKRSTWHRQTRNLLLAAGACQAFYGACVLFNAVDPWPLAYVFGLAGVLGAMLAVLALYHLRLRHHDITAAAQRAGFADSSGRHTGAFQRPDTAIVSALELFDYLEKGTEEPVTATLVRRTLTADGYEVHKARDTDQRYINASTVPSCYGDPQIWGSPAGGPFLPPDVLVIPLWTDAAEPDGEQGDDWPVGDIQMLITSRPAIARPALLTARDGFTLATQAAEAIWGEPTGRRHGDDLAVWWRLGKGAVYIHCHRAVSTIHWLSPSHLDVLTRATPTAWGRLTEQIAWRLPTLYHGDTITWTGPTKCVLTVRQEAADVVVEFRDHRTPGLAPGVASFLRDMDFAAVGGDRYVWARTTPWPLDSGACTYTASAVSSILFSLMGADTPGELVIAEGNTLGRVRGLASEAHDPGGLG